MIRSVVRRPAPWLPGEVRRVSDIVGAARAIVDGADAVVHLASPNEAVTRLDPYTAVTSTIAGSRAIAQACAETKVKRLVYLSTIHVYGNALSTGAVIDESYP